MAQLCQALAQYGFRDPHGHSLASVAEFQELVERAGRPSFQERNDAA